MAHAVDFIDDGKTAQSIISGTISSKGAQPWIAALAGKNANYPASVRQICTAALVDRYWVITAAHCLDAVTPEDHEVIIGRDDLDSTAGEVFEIAEVLPMPLGGDIGLVRLKTPSSARTIAMASASQEETYLGKSLTLYGWGNTFYKASTTARCEVQAMDGLANAAAFACKTYVFKTEATNSAILQQANVTLQNYDTCNARFKAGLDGDAPPFQFGVATTPDLLCAWDPLEKSTPCYGDSGGPLVAMDGNTPVLVGITSFGAMGGCAPAGQIGVYARVSYFRDYLNYRIGGDPALSFAQLCPAIVKPTVSIQPLPTGESRVEIQWPPVDKARSYRLFYSAQASKGQNINKVVLDSGTTSMTVILPSGASYHVKLQAQGETCDGPMSDLLTVVAP